MKPPIIAYYNHVFRWLHLNVYRLAINHGWLGNHKWWIVQQTMFEHRRVYPCISHIPWIPLYHYKIPSNKRDTSPPKKTAGLGPYITLAATLQYGRSEVALRLAAALPDVQPGGCCAVACRAIGDSGRYLESHAIPQRWNNESLLPKNYQLLVICRLTDYWSWRSMNGRRRLNIRGNWSWLMFYFTALGACRRRPVACRSAGSMLPSSLTLCDLYLKVPKATCS